MKNEKEIVQRLEGLSNSKPRYSLDWIAKMNQIIALAWVLEWSDDAVSHFTSYIER